MRNLNKVKAEVSRREYLTIEELKRLIGTECKYEIMKQAFLFSCLCGLRVSDIRKLKCKTISDRNDMYRNEQVCKKLKAKHGLYFAGGKEQVKQHRLKEPDKSKYEIYTAVKNEIGKSRNWQQLQERLAEKGITVRFKRKGQTDEIQGISFSKGEYTFKGSEIDRSFSFSKLDKCFGYAGMNVAGSQRQTTFAPVREQALAPGKADSPLITGSLGLFSASSPPVDEEPNFNLRKKKKKKKQLKL